MLAKSIADRLDIGTILLNATPEDTETISGDEVLREYFSRSSPLQKLPNMKLSVFKNRRGSVTQCYIWIYADKGCCRYTPIGATTWDLVPIENYPLLDLTQGYFGEVQQ